MCEQRAREVCANSNSRMDVPRSTGFGELRHGARDKEPARSGGAAVRSSEPGVVSCGAKGVGIARHAYARAPECQVKHLKNRSALAYPADLPPHYQMRAGAAAAAVQQPNHAP